ncbi:MAG: nuclear transport factor 2 family protein [Gemmatimonadota bacterium]|nr:MAG: nuclear transport factor 2 family protein [Gemmatimonadota bacterium]
MDPVEQRSVIDRYLAAYNAFDIPGMMATIHHDIEFKNISGGVVNATAAGERDFRQLAEQSKGLFSSRNQTIKTFESHEDTAVIEVRYEAVLASDLPNGMKAGETLRLDGRSEFVFRDGRIYRLVDYS